MKLGFRSSKIKSQPQITYILFKIYKDIYGNQTYLFTEPEDLGELNDALPDEQIQLLILRLKGFDINYPSDHSGL